MGTSYGGRRAWPDLPKNSLKAVLRRTQANAQMRLERFVADEKPPETRGVDHRFMWSARLRSSRRFFEVVSRLSASLDLFQRLAHRLGNAHQHERESREADPCV